MNLIEEHPHFIGFIFAFFTIYVALKIARNLRRHYSTNIAYHMLLIGGAIVLGMGLWAHHIFGVEAFEHNLPLEYDPVLIMISLAFSITASGVGLYWTSRPHTTTKEMLLVGAFMGIAVTLTHHVGVMAITNIQATLTLPLLILSFLMAILLFQGVLWVLINGDKYPWIVRYDVLLAIGIAVLVESADSLAIHETNIIVIEKTITHLPDAEEHNISPIYMGLSTALLMILFLTLSTEIDKTLITLKESNDKLRAREADLEKALSNAEKANQAKSYFLANMSHELQTPLHAIFGITSLLENRGMSEKELHYLDTIKASGHRLNDLITEVLEYSKLESSEFQPTDSKVNFLELTQEIIDHCKKSIPNENIKLILQSSPNRSLTILTDPLYIRQVITNLINNAIKFSKKGDITIRVSSKEETADNLRIRFEVEDHGIGIKESDFHKIFLPFSQVNGTPTREYGGAGLGLALSKKIITKLGGEIGFKSKIHEGSTFWFEAPFKLAKENVIDT